MGDTPSSSDVIVEDSEAPSVWYNGTWSYVTGAEFHGGSQRASSEKGASVHFAFIGEHFWYFATPGPDRGACSISVDGAIVLSALSTHSAAVQPAKQFYSQDVEPGSHTVTVTDLDGQTTTIDYFIYRPVLNESPTPQDIGLSNSSISFRPQTTGAEYVWFSWDRNFDHGVYTVSIDGGVPTNFSAYSPDHTEISVLYSSALSPGLHTLTFTNVEANRRLGVTSIIYRPISRNGPIATSLSAATTMSSQTSLSTGTTSSVQSTLPTLNSSTSLSTDPWWIETRFPASSASSQLTPSASSTPSGSVSSTTIAGAAAGAASLIIIPVVVVVVVVVICIKRKRRRRTALHKEKLARKRVDIATSGLSSAGFMLSPDVRVSQPPETAPIVYATGNT